jgi:hypothetical protein
MLFEDQLLAAILFNGTILAISVDGDPRVISCALYQNDFDNRYPGTWQMCGFPIQSLDTNFQNAVT